MFQFPGLPSLKLSFSLQDTCALPQVSSLIRISAAISAVCALPQLFAACRVLLRPLVPRHPPYALFRLTYLAARARRPLISRFSFEIVVISPSFSSVNNFFDFVVFVSFLLFNFQGAFKKNLLLRPLVENKGIEPLTPCVQGRCSPI